MKEKVRASIVTSATPFLEPGETIRSAARGFEGPSWALFLGAIGALLLVKQRLVVVTDRNIYLMNADRLFGTKAKSVVAKHARGSVAVTHQPGKTFDHLRVGSADLKIGKLLRKDAEAAAKDAA